MTDPLLIQVEGIRVHRGRRAVLRDLSWRVRRGEHWALMGRNGSGKTTLLDLLQGKVWPYAGEGRVEVLGERLGACDLFSLRRRIGWVGPSSQMEWIRHLPVRSFVFSGVFGAMGRWDRTSPPEMDRVQRLLVQLECEHLADRTFGFLSEGEQRRILIARAWMGDPQLLLLDEPCSGLDFVARERVLHSLRSLLRSEGPTLIYVTHHPEEIFEEITHVLILENGRVAAAGPKEQVLTDAVLSRVFGIPTEVAWVRGRPRLSLRL